MMQQYQSSERILPVANRVFLLTFLLAATTPVLSSVDPSPHNEHSFLRKRDTDSSSPSIWSWKFPPRAKQETNETSSFLRDRDRDLIINQETEHDKQSQPLLERFNPLTLLARNQGHRANIRDFPFFAHWSEAYCGASLIHDDILLTAAHCGKDADSPLDIKQARIASPFRTAGGVVRTIVHQAVHPQYNAELKVYDFQLLKLHTSALVDPYTGNRTEARLVERNADSANPAVGAELTAVGFGVTTPDGSSGNSDVLMDVHIQRFDHQLCEQQYGPKRIPDSVMMCMGAVGGGKDVCQGKCTKCTPADKVVLVFSCHLVFFSLTTFAVSPIYCFAAATNRRLGWTHRGCQWRSGCRR